VAPLLAQTIRAQALARDLAESRTATVTAVEEERRRLRRDLHDGLGPTLTGVAFAADAARNHLSSRDPAAADALLARLRADTSAAIVEVRRLVEGLRPPVLDELGLLGAVRQYATGLRATTGPVVEVRELGGVDTLPAAVEVAVYRIVVEALTNVVRHSSALRAVVELGAESGVLRVRVLDDAPAGSAHTPSPWRPGTGVTSMRERARQVGGTLRAGPSSDGGLVEAVIPLG
jgi:signal transduction histidine kinase